MWPVLCRNYALISMLFAADVRAEAFMADFDEAQWRVQRSPLVCRLVHAVPHFGDATFETFGGGHQRFVLHAKKNPFISGPSQITAAAPSWNPSRQSLALGSVDVTEGEEPLQLDAEPTAQLLNSLNAGLVPMFARPLQSDAHVIASIAISPINFAPAYRQYTECIRQLFPVTFDAIKNTVVEFSPEQSDLSAVAQKKIDLLLRYIAVDKSVTHFEIEGVSSDSKRSLDNLTLSKQRTQQVSEYLMSRGIDAKFIESNYRTARFAKGSHRFVSIRLKRDSIKAN